MLLFKVLIALFGFLSLGLADPCDWNGATPDVNVVYGDKQCPPHRRLMGNGACDLFNSPTTLTFLNDRKHPCKGFCQVNTIFQYAGEFPLGGTFASGWKQYGSSQWMRFGLQWKEPIGSLPAIPREILNRDISGGLSRVSRGLAKVDHMDIELQDGQHGYFTFLPMDKYVCGSYSHAPFDHYGTLSGKAWCRNSDMTRPNQCVIERSNAGDGGFWWFASEIGEMHVRGHTTFVYTDADGKRLQPAEQAPRYQYAMESSQALSDTRYEGWRNVWRNDVLNKQFQGGQYGPDDHALDCRVAERERQPTVWKDADVTHCAYLIGELMENPEMLVPIANHDEVPLSKRRGGCFLAVVTSIDWDKTCKVTFAEVATAAGFVSFNCMKEWNVKGQTRFGIQGTHQIRADSLCAGYVRLSGRYDSKGGIDTGSMSDGALAGLSDQERAVAIKFHEDFPDYNGTVGEPLDLDLDWPEQYFNESSTEFPEEDA